MISENTKKEKHTPGDICEPSFFLILRRMKIKDKIQNKHTIQIKYNDKDNIQ